jgi:regulator of CtrA degradation
MNTQIATATATVNFFKKFTDSEQFDRVFAEGMGLVEETANYLDGEGRTDARDLTRLGAIAYATESMRLTTRLMQMASWLLLQRAVVAGELTTDEARREKHRINLAEIGRGNPIEGGEELPKGLLELVTRSLRLLERIKTLDTMLPKELQDTAKHISPVSLQMDQLQRAFGTR